MVKLIRSILTEKHLAETVCRGDRCWILTNHCAEIIAV